jgi:hypothetical protein
VMAERGSASTKSEEPTEFNQRRGAICAFDLLVKFLRCPLQKI